MSKHTPGPWIFENRDGDHPLNDQNGWGCHGLWAVNGGFILGDGAGWDSGYQGPNEADARLIAAAPDMLELLQSIRAVMPRTACAGCTVDNYAEDIDALLAKIDGGGE